MGSDAAPGPELEGAMAAVRAFDLDVVLVGDPARLNTDLPVEPASEVIAAGASPRTVLAARFSSMHVACSMVAFGDADAFVTAGPSGAALVLASTTYAKFVDRPAICTVLPAKDGKTFVLCDAGATVDPTPKLLAQFGLLGAAYDRCVHDRARPRVGVLANGSEPEKGTKLTRDASAWLAERAAHYGIDFTGYVEADKLFRGAVDVVATDGFTGNAILKTCEGIAADLFGVDYVSPIGGALLAGVDKVTVIAHGRSDARAICSALGAAADFVRGDLPARLAAAIAPV